MTQYCESRWQIIEKRARLVLLGLWNEKDSIWPHDMPLDPLGAVQPAVALVQRGFKIETVQSLGQTYAEGRLFEVAAALNRVDSTVQISNMFSKEIQHFTLAHELGHVELNHKGDAYHRDIPVERSGYQKDALEREADWFASCFCMPGKQVRSWFRRLFACDRFVLNDDTASALGLGTRSLDSVAEQIRCKRDLALLLSRSINYGGRPISKLHEIFAVAPTAMARRLEELDLVAEPEIPRRPRYRSGRSDR